MYPQGVNFKTCHSSRSVEILFREDNPSCIQCSQRESCRTAAIRIREGARPITSPPVQVVQQYQQPYHPPQGGSVLSYNPLPDEGEGAFARALVNMVSAGVSSGLREGANFLSLYKIPLKKKEK